jgi:hypothetical protein
VDLGQYSMNEAERWPSLRYEDWAATKKTLHMVGEMVGKARLALAPAQPEWLNACLYLDARGFTTGAMPYGTTVVTMRIDVYDAAIRIDVSDGRTASVRIGPNRSVADIWADFRTALAGLHLHIDIWEKPQETPDTTPFSENTHDRTIDPEQAQMFHRIVCAIDGAFEEFRSGFFGRSGVQFWWGGLDFGLLLFTGKRVTPPDDRGFMARYDLDAEHMSAGFWPGDDSSPEATFFAYLVPRPEGCEVAPIQPAHASWTETMGEWTMPYELVRTSADPRQAVLDFLKSVYQVAVTNGGWDADAFRYEPPGPAPRA